MFLVVGYGNPLRGDDSVGSRVLELLDADGEGVQGLWVHQLTPELAEAVSQAEGVIFVDARREGIPGEIRIEAVKPAPSSVSAFTHALTAEALLEYSSSVFGRCPEAFLLSVTGRNFDLGATISWEVARVLPAAVGEIMDILEYWRAGTPTSEG